MLGLIRPNEGSVRLFGRDPQLGVAALEGVAGFVEAPAFYPYLSGRENLRLCAALDGGDAAERIDEVLEVVELQRPRQGQGRRLLARDAPAARDRLGAAAAAAAAAARRAGDRARPGRDARHARADPRPRRAGDHGAALQPPPGRGRRALQPGRDRPRRPGRLRGLARASCATVPGSATGCGPTTTSGRAASAPPRPGSRRCARRPAGGLLFRAAGERGGRRALARAGRVRRARCWS